jgi:hypothetical protein
MRTNILNLAAFLLILSVSFSACTKGEIDFDSVDVNVDSEINFRMVEIFDKSPRTFQFQCFTEKIYSCCAPPIYVVTQQSSNNIDISFKGVIQPEFGIAATGPATAYIDLGALSNGMYHLTLHNGVVKQTGKLVVSSDSYRVNFDNKSAFRFLSTLLNRIPEHTIWGNIGNRNQTLVQSFITALMNVGATKKSYLPGDYREFEIGKNGDIVQGDKDSGYSFIFHYSGNIEDVEQLVKQYGTEQTYISVHTDKGDQFLSWMYK